MRYVTRTIKMAVVEYEYLDRGTKEVGREFYKCRASEKENKIRKDLSNMLEERNCVFVSIVDIQIKNHHFEMEEDKYIAEANLVSVSDC